MLCLVLMIDSININKKNIDYYIYRIRLELNEVIRTQYIFQQYTVCTSKFTIFL